MASSFDVLVTADEAFQAFERAVLSAETSIVAGFRIFDMTTRLRSPEGLAIGKTWFDLLEHVVRKGVSFELTVSDFDPVMATELHEVATKTVRQGAALAELAGAAGSNVTVRAHLHPAKAGLVPWLAFLPVVLGRMRKARAIRDDTRLSRGAIGLKETVLPQMHTVTHHQKLAVIDDATLYVGGLDLNERRYDTQDHDRPSAETWSDVQAIVRNEAAATSVRRHLETFADTTEGAMQVTSAPGILRTLSKPRRLQFPYLSPQTVLSELEEAHLAAFRTAVHHIHIETQFFRSTRIADGLAKAAQNSSDLTATIIMPGTPDELAHEDHDSLDMKFGLAKERDAVAVVKAAFGSRLTIASPVRPLMAQRTDRDTLAGSELIHVHNKVLLRDDSYLLISSANLNGRSLRWDTEVGVETTDAQDVMRGRNKLFSHWWFDRLPPEALNAATRFDWWQDRVGKNGLLRPQNRAGFLVPFDSKKNADLRQNLPGVTEDMV